MRRSNERPERARASASLKLCPLRDDLRTWRRAARRSRWSECRRCHSVPARRKRDTCRVRAIKTHECQIEIFAIFTAIVEEDVLQGERERGPQPGVPADSDGDDERRS